MRIKMDPQPPINSTIEHSMLFDRVWWADSPDWNPWCEHKGDSGFYPGISAYYQLPMVINSPSSMPGDDSVKAILEDGAWYWIEEKDDDSRRK